MARQMSLDAYRAALEEATGLIARSEATANAGEPLDWLLRKIVSHPVAPPPQPEEIDDGEILLARLQADVDDFVRRKTEPSL